MSSGVPRWGDLSTRRPLLFRDPWTVPLSEALPIAWRAGSQGNAARSAPTSGERVSAWRIPPGFAGSSDLMGPPSAGDLASGDLGLVLAACTSAYICSHTAPFGRGSVAVFPSLEAPARTSEGGREVPRLEKGPTWGSAPLFSGGADNLFRDRAARVHVSNFQRYLVICR